MSIHPNQGWGTVLFWLHCNSPTSSIPQHRGPHGPPERNRGVPPPQIHTMAQGGMGPPPTAAQRGDAQPLAAVSGLLSPPFFLRRVSIHAAPGRAVKPDRARELRRMFFPDMMSSPKPSWWEKA